jgi:hypothetical protein
MQVELTALERRVIVGELEAFLMGDPQDEPDLAEAVSAARSAIAKLS